MSLERIEVGGYPQPGSVWRRDGPVSGDLDRGGEEPVAAGGRPGGRVEGHLDEGAGGDGEREVEVGQQPEAVRPRVRREAAAEQVGQRREPSDAAYPAGEDHVRLDHVYATAHDQVARLEGAAHHLAGGDAQRGAAPQRRVALDVV